MSDVEFVHSERELIIINGVKVGAIILENDGNVLTNIRIAKDQRGKGYARDAIQSWLENCKSQGFSEAYVANVNHEATRHILDTLQNFRTEETTQRRLPIDIKSGIHISDLCYRIHL